MSLTVANSSFTLSAATVGGVPVFPVAVPIEGYAADDAFDTSEVKPTEVLMGVDGNLSGGYVAYATPLTFVLQADSPSILIMDTAIEAMDGVKEAIIFGASIAVPGISKLHTFIKGYLTSGKKTPGGKKLLQPMRYEITFEKCISAVLP